ncbi:MAG: polymer-forming cytoskeletal protein [Steroidobacteraceae bacterium]
MALWKDSPTPPSTTPGSPVLPAASTGIAPREAERGNPAPLHADAQRKAREHELRESVISAGLTIDGKIDGAGSLRLGGRFKGDVSIDGNLTIDAGAHLAGQVRASVVVIGGELEGNVIGAKRVEVLDTAVVTGDVKAGTIAVAAGARMRGQMEFGWEEKPGASRADHKGNGSAT